MDDSVSRYPVDFDALEKGSYITPKDVARAARADVGTPKFSIFLMGLCAECERRLLDRGLQAVVRVDNYGVRVLTDAEAAEYTDHQFGGLIRRLGRTLHRQNRVDTKELGTSQRQQHERALLVNSRTFQAAANARKDALKLTAHERDNPKLA